MDEKREFSLTYKTFSNEIRKQFQVHRKGWINVLRMNQGKGYEVVLQNKRAVKGEQSLGVTKILVLSKYHMYKNDIIQWDPENTIEEYWKIREVEDYKPFLHCLVIPFHIEDSDVFAELRKYGFDDSAEYFSKAKKLLQEAEPIEFSDCKNNCRKALAAFFDKAAGTQDFRKATRILIKKSIIGKREEELLNAFDELSGALSGFLAKKGSHPPMPDKEEARLAVEVTEAFLRYLLTKLKPEK